MKKTILVTAAGLLTVASTQAQVVSSYQNISPIDDQNGGVVDVNLSSNSASLFVTSNDLNSLNRDFAIDVFSSGYLSASDLNANWAWSSSVISLGGSIDANTTFHADSNFIYLGGSLESVPVGTNAYLGNRRVEASSTYYGYVQVQRVGGGFGKTEWAFIGSAYETTPDKAITVTPITPVPEPSSTALLGLGAIGLLTRRKR